MIAAICALTILDAYYIPPWVPPAIARLKTSGILVGYPDGLVCYRFVRQGPMRYECAVAAHASTQHVQHIFRSVRDELARHNVNVPLSAAIKADLKEVQTWRSQIEDLQRLTKEFAFELSEMGVQDHFDREVSKLQSELTAVVAHGWIVAIVADARSGSWIPNTR